MDAWNVTAEALGFASGVVLLIPAIAINKHLRQVGQAQRRFAAATGELSQTLAERSAPVLAQAQIPKWEQRDQWALVAGIVGFVASSTIKLCLAIGAP